MGNNYKDADKNTVSITFTNNSGTEYTSSNFTKLTSGKGVNFTVSADHTASVFVVAVTKNSTSGNGIALKKNNGESWDNVTTYTDAPSTTYTRYTASFSNLAAGEYRMERNSQENAAVYVKVVEVSNLTPTSEVLKSSAAVKVGETTLTKDAGTNGYSVDETTITLSDDITAVSTPTNVKLVKTITYDDSSTEDEDVVITFDGTVTAGYYIGTASIGLTGDEIDYTVKVKQNVSPTAELTATSGTISMANSYTVIGSTTVTLTGANLTDGTYDVTSDVAGTTISPSSFTVADGSVDQEFTITTSGSSAATTVFTFGTSDMGVAAPTYTLTYETVAKRSLSQSDVSAATTWDWTKAGSASIQLTAETSPTKSVEFLLSDLQEMPNDANFNSQALKVVCEWPNRGSNSYIQGNIIKFNTTVPGTIDVTFSNTGGSRPYRYLRVNGTQTSYKSGTSDMVEATGIAVPAGEVVVDFYIPDASDPQERSGDVVGTTMCRVNKIIFTPVASVSVEVTDAGYATYVPSYDLDFSATDIKAYKVKVESQGKATMTQVDNVPAGTPVLLYKAGGATEDIPVMTGAAAVDDNDLVAGEGATVPTYETVSTENDYTNMILNNGSEGIGFYFAAGNTVAANRAYLHIATTLAPDAEETARGMILEFADEKITGINEAATATEAAQKEGKFVVDGKLVIFKKGMKFNANGVRIK